MPQLPSPKTYPAYPSERLNTFVFPVIPYWNCSVFTPTDLDFELQVDTVQTFSSPNLKHCFKNSAHIVAFREGQIARAFVLELAPRANQLEQIWYWRVRINSSRYVSDWTTIQQLRVFSKESLRIADEVSAQVADESTYSKEARSTNLHQLMHFFAEEKDLFDFEQALTKQDFYLGLTRDSRLADLFGNLISHVNDSSTDSTDYRNQVISLLDAFMNRAGVVQGIIDTVVAFLAEPPSIIDVNSIAGWILGEHVLKDPAHPSLGPVATLYTDLSKGFGWRLVIYNSWGLTYSQDVLEAWLFRMIPLHTRATITYATFKNNCALFNHAIDWSQGSFTNVDQVGNSIRLGTGGLTGEWTSAAQDVQSSILSWKGIEADLTDSGQQISFFISYSSDGSTYTAFEDVTGSRLPSSTGAVAFKMKVTFSSSSLTYLPSVNSLKVPYLRT